MLANLMKALARRFHFTLFKEIAMPKTLIILAHPNLAQSTVNKVELSFLFSKIMTFFICHE